MCARSSPWISSTDFRASTVTKRNSLRQAVVLADQLRLVARERIEDVVAERQVHARLPVVHALPLEHARDQVLDVDLEVEHQVGHERHAEELRASTSASAPMTALRANAVYM